MDQTLCLSSPGEVVGGIHAGRHPVFRRRAAVEEMRGRGMQFEDYDAPARPEYGIARTPDGGEGAWFKDSEGNLLGVVRCLPG